MSIHKPTRHMFAFALILTSALSGCATYGKCGIGGCPGDAKITSNVQAQLDQHPELGGPNSINVETLNRVVYLDGLVSTGIESRAAESVALQVPGVSRVVNSVAVAH
jgi:osmotically-inducible protein OsmY